MNTEERSLRGKQRQAIQQTTITLPYFDEEVPAIFLADGTTYLPVRALCRMLGLRAETHIPRWRKLVLWANACKLPLQTARGQRMVWCLHMGALPFWCVCFNWSLVPAERREQLRQATDGWQQDVAQAQRLLLECYRSLRRYLFAFLELLLSQGKTLISEATAQARKMVQEQAMAPIIDVVTIEASGEATQTGTLPLFPVVPHEDREQFFASLSKLAQWHQDMAVFISHLKHP